MSRAWAWLGFAVALILLAPSASAAKAASLQIVGSSRATGAADALFAIADGRGLSWSATAKEIVVERDGANFTRIDAIKSTSYGRVEQASQAYGPGELHGLEARDGGAMLARSLGAPFSGVTSTGSRLVAVGIQDPSFAEFGASDVRTSQTTHLYVDESMPGRFVNLTSSGGDFELRGTLLLVLYDVDYAVTTAQGSAVERTGRFESASVAGVTQGRDEQQRVTLVDAVLTLHAPGEAALFASQGHVDFNGILSLQGGDAPLAAPGLAPLAAAEGEGRYQGSSSLDLAPAGGSALRLESARAPSPLAPVAEGASAPLLALAALVLVAIAGVTFGLSRRARRAADDTAAALLAMEERRFADALAPLARALARRPQDALLHLDLALCLEETGRGEEARRQYETTLGLAPANAEALYYYARLLARQRRPAESAAHLAEALVLDPRLTDMARAEQAFRGMTGISV